MDEELERGKSFLFALSIFKLLNEVKTKYIIFHTRFNKPPDNFDIILNGIALERVEVTKFLGVLIQENLNWNRHIGQVCNKIARSTALLAKLKHYVPRYVLLMIYNSLCMYSQYDIEWIWDCDYYE